MSHGLLLMNLNHINVSMCTLATLQQSAQSTLGKKSISSALAYHVDNVLQAKLFRQLHMHMYGCVIRTYEL